MLDRAWGGSFPWRRDGRPQGSRKPSRAGRRPLIEGLEGRQLLTASLAPIADVTVPSSLGFQVPLDGSGSGSSSQTFTVTSSNPDIGATVATGPFITVNVTHTASSVPGDISFAGSFTYQAFSDLTPNTSTRIDEFTNGDLPGVTGSYNGTQFFRVVQDFSGTGGPGDTVIQGGPQDSTGSGTNPLELNQQLAFVGPGAVAIANADNPNSTPPVTNTDGQQFFVTTGPQTELDFGFTLFGQVVNGENIVSDIGNVKTTTNSSGEDSMPVTPVNITVATTSTTSPDGVIHIDATTALPGETSTITVTATDPSTGTKTTRTFNVTVVTDTTTHPSTFTFKPIASPITQGVTNAGPTTIQLTALNNNTPPSGGTATVTTSFAIISQPTHGTVTVNAATGQAVYTPNPGFIGKDSFTFQPTNTNSNTAATPTTAVGNIAKVTLNVGPTTGAVRVIGNVLVVTPPPTTVKATNTIVISQVDDANDPTNDTLQITVNGKVDFQDPLVSSIKQIVVYGGKSNDNIAVAPNVDASIPVMLSGGQSGKNTIQAGAGATLEHGWFGKNTLIAGTGANQLVGKAGSVKFKPTTATTEIFAGVPHPGYSKFFSYHDRTSVSITPPGGTFFKFVNGKLVPIPTPPKTVTRTTPRKNGSTSTTTTTG